VAAGVSVKVGVDADEGELVQLDTGLLAYFAAAGVLYCLADFDKATRQCIAPDTRRMLAADEKHASNWIEDNAIGPARGFAVVPF
jgi:hypothetical protein